MSGRQYHHEELDRKAREGLEGYPKVLLKYYKWSCGREATTKTVFINRVKNFVTWCQKEGVSDSFESDSAWEKITKRTIRNYIDSISEKNLKDGTVKKLKGRTLWDVVTILENFFQFLVDEELLEKSPVPSRRELGGMIPTQATEKKVEALSWEEVAAVCKAIDAKRDNSLMDKTLFLVGCTTGLRGQALADIDISDVDEGEQMVTAVDKGSQRRIIYLDPDTFALLAKWLKVRRNMTVSGEDAKNALFVYESRRGVRRVGRKYVAALLDEVTEGLDRVSHITSHWMRKTCATNTYRLTHDIYATARKVGHKNINNTKRYVDTQDDDREMARSLGAELAKAMKEETDEKNNEGL